LLPDELLSIVGLDVKLTEKQRAKLSREEVAAMLAAGIRFEAVLNAVFSLELAYTRRLGDPRHTYMLHEVAEETRHQRAFLRLREQISPVAKNPLDLPIPRFVARRIIRMTVKHEGLFGVMLLAGEEIPDFLQKLASEHPQTDPVLREVNRYHRAEEARHLSFARTVFPEVWAKLGRLERWRVRRVAPRLIGLLFETMVHPGVYEVVGLPGFKTWRAANRSAPRRAIRYRATRPILDTMCSAGVMPRDRVPRGWRDLCGVDRNGRPLANDPALPVG
jgi:hypothetical protein